MLLLYDSGLESEANLFAACILSLAARFSVLSSALIVFSGCWLVLLLLAARLFALLFLYTSPPVLARLVFGLVIRINLTNAIESTVKQPGTPTVYSFARDERILSS